MSENTLLAKITADTEAKIAEIQAKAEADVVAVQRETEHMIVQLQQAAKGILQKKKEQQELVGVSKARQAANIAQQQAKRSAVDAAFMAVFSKLQELPADEYVTLFTALAKKTLPADVAVTRVVAPANRLDETTKVLSALQAGEVAVVADAAIKGGMLFETAAGVYDVTLTRLFNDKRDAMEIEIVNLALA